MGIVGAEFGAEFGAGVGRESVRGKWFYRAGLLCLLSQWGQAESLYQYKNEAGEWVFTDRPAADALSSAIERPAPWEPPSLDVSELEVSDAIELVAHNRYASPVHLWFELSGNNIQTTIPNEWTWQVVLAAGERKTVQTIKPVLTNRAWEYQYQYSLLPGDPAAQHDASYLYQAPFAPGGRYRVTQAYPDKITHSTVGSKFAIDFAMPIGTPVHAARAGVVLDITYKNYKGGIKVSDFNEANVVHIYHADGTFASYVHLHWDSVRVRPGQRVKRGQYIADSGNTGFTTGPHLHFSVQKNQGGRWHSVPITFAGEGRQPLVVKSGDWLQAN